jgi:hypothetical protein
VAAKVTDTLVVGIQATYRFHMEKFNLKKSNEIDSKERYRVKTQVGSQLWET